MRKTVLITGTSKGIGFALTEVFLKNNYKVIGTCLSSEISKIADTGFELHTLDLSNLNNIKEFEKDFQDKGVGIDILINNAAVGPDLDFTLPEEMSFKQTLDVNVTGTIFFTEVMLSHMKSGGKIINISSKMGSIELCELTDSVAYRMSKTALNMYTKILTNRLIGKLKIAAVHPGWVRTTLTKRNMHGRLSPQESANKLFDFILSDFETGIFWNVETQSKCKW